MFARILLASLAARRLRLALAMMVVAVGVGVAIALATLAIETGDDFARTLRAAGPNFVVRPAAADWRGDFDTEGVQPARAGAVLPTSVVADLKRSFWKYNVLHAMPEVGIAAQLAGVPATILGTWFDHDVPTESGTWRTGLKYLRPHWRLVGRWPTEQQAEVALGRDLARRTGLSVGQQTTVAVGDRVQMVRVAAVVDAGGLEDRQAWMPLETLRSLASLHDVVDRVWLSALVKAEPPGPVPDPKRDPRGYERYLCTAYPAVLAHDLAAQLDNAEVLPLAEVVAGEARVVGRLDLLMLMLALATFGASVLGLISTTTATVVERRAELALLSSLGASGGQLGALLLCETVLVSLAGGLLGWLIGGLGAQAIRGQALGHTGTLQPLLLPVALLLSVVLALAGTLGPLRMRLKLDPAAVLRG
ncbi:MAG TPA: FtsX-like permease family protein [Candidatus Eisenbacteria bacterium]